MLDTGADLAHVQGQIGHASPVTTSQYDRQPDRARFAAARRVHVPYCMKWHETISSVFVAVDHTVARLVENAEATSRLPCPPKVSWASHS